MVNKIKSVPMEATKSIATLVYLPDLAEASLDKFPSSWYNNHKIKSYKNLSI